MSAQGQRRASNLSYLLLVAAVGAAILANACSSPVDDETASQASATSGCGGEGQACCAEGRRCKGELGCSAGVCRDIDADMVAYAEYCKEELGFADPRAKMAFVSCFDAQTASGQREPTGRQALLSLTLGQGADARRLELIDNGPAISAGRDVWDLMFGNGGAAEGCDNPNYLQSRCDPYYRLNVFSPDPGNANIVAALHCRSDGLKPTPATAISADARREAYEASPASLAASDRARLFEQWNASNEIVLTMTNLRSGKACFFHAKSPYFGSRIPAPDDETSVSTPEDAERVWDELPVKPPYSKDDVSHHGEWLRNGANAWHRPDYMRCVGCHDSGPFMHDPFIDSMVDYLPSDRRTRPYVPLGYQSRIPSTMIRTADVRTASGALEPPRCTSCHSMGSQNACGMWFDRAVGWSFAYSASTASKQSEHSKRYMPFEHGMTSSQDFYAEYGPHIDAMKCCCEHPSWRGCKTVPAETPQAPGVEGTGEKSCTESTCGGHGQPCCEGWSSCNHSGLTCASGQCVFADEVQ